MLITYFMRPNKSRSTYSIIAYGYLDAPPLAVARDISSDGDLVFRMVRTFNECHLPPLCLSAAIRDMLG